MIFEHLTTTFILHSVSFLCWTIVYLEAIRIGLKEKTYCIPFAALILNIAWETVHLLGEFLERGNVSFSLTVWLILDILILATYFKYGKKYFPKNINPKWFIALTFLLILIALFIHYLFIEQFGLMEGRFYSAFIQNLIISGLFIQMLLFRNSSEGQSYIIAIGKLIGTLMPTISTGILCSKTFNDPNFFILGLGICCLIFDSIYLYLLYRVKKNFILQRENGYIF